MMLRVGLTLLSVVMLILSGLGIPSTTGAPQQQTDVPRLRLLRGTFDARQPAPASVNAPWLEAAPDSYAIIQFSVPPTVADRERLQATGVKIREYLPDYAYLVQGTPNQLTAAARLSNVYARTAFVLADKLSPTLLSAVRQGKSLAGNFRITGWPGEEAALVRDLQTLNVVRGPVALNGEDALLEIARLPAVRWIEYATQPHLLNDYARTIMQVEPAWTHYGLFGSNQLIAVADSGLDTGDFGTMSPDFTGRISATHVLSAGGDLGDNFGHGTHVAGSIAGAGVQSGANPAQHVYTNTFAGVAPEAHLVVQAFEALSDGSIIGLDPDYYQLFAQAYADGARLHSDSWGDYTGPITDTAAQFGGYPFGAQRTDQFVWEHPDMTIFVAAGNSGVDGIPTPPFGFCTGGNGVVDPDSLLSPGTAKNVITVGAGESNRTSGGVGAYPWLLLTFCFGVEPIATDLVSNNANGMAAFSSRGPVDDGRLKPDIVAPGTNIVSNKSHYPGATPLWGAHETNPHYVYSGGTSMATPLTAGAGTLVRQWLGVRGIITPSAAALKGVLLNTTIDMAPGQYGVGATQEITFARPNSVAGWGRTSLGFIGAPFPYALWLDDHTGGLTTGQTITYTHTPTNSLRVVTNTQPLRVMLTWTDPPASLSASAQLVNDLDLIMTGPDGSTYRGNVSPSGDRINNVEGVVVASPPIGVYTVTVRTFNVPIATQPYALVVGGPIANDIPISNLQAANSSPTGVGSSTAFTATATGTNILYTWNFGDGATGSGNPIGHSYTNVGVYTAIVTATNSVSVMTATTPVTITAAGVTNLQVVNSSPTALGNTTNFTATANGTDVTYAWNFGDGATSSGATTTHAYGAVGFYTAIVTASNSINTVVTTTPVTITDAAITNLNAVNSSPTALGNTTHFTATANGSSIVYAWNFGDGQTGSGATPTHVYSALGVYTAVVTASNNISSVVATTPVTITDQPISGLTAANSSPTVLGNPTAFIATASGTNIAYAWNFGDGTTGSGNATNHTYPAVGVYTAVVTASNSSSALTATTYVTITEAAIANLSVSNSSPTTWGSVTYFTATATGGGITYLWNFGDGQTGSGTPIGHSYAAPGRYTATVTAANSVNTLTATTIVDVWARVYLPILVRGL
ncbi:Serine protease AprX [Thermoflexales bacterium]|nr:Serine protease AprX [Thermoflexales bacterium]